MFKKILCLSLIALMLFSMVAASSADHTLTVQSQGWLGGDDGGGPGKIVVFGTNGNELSSTPISPGETKTVNLPQDTKRVGFHSDYRKDCYNANLNGVDNVFALFPNANFYVHAWFYTASCWDNKISFPRSGTSYRKKNIDAWRVTTLEENQKLTIADYNARVYTIEKNNTNTLISDNEDYILIPASANKKTLLIKSKSKDYTVMIPIYTPPNDITITSDNGGMAVSYNNKRIVANKDNPYQII